MSELYDRLSAFGRDPERMGDFAKSCGLEGHPRPAAVYDLALSTVIEQFITYLGNDAPIRYLISAIRSPRFQEGIGARPLFTAPNGSSDELTTLVFEKDVPERASQFAEGAAIDSTAATQSLMVVTSVVASGLVALSGGDVSADSLAAIIDSERTRLAERPSTAAAATVAAASGSSPSKGLLIGGGVAALLFVGGLVAVLGGGGDAADDVAADQASTATADADSVAEDTETADDTGQETSGVDAEGDEPGDDLPFADDQDDERYFTIAVPMQDITDINPNASGTFNFTFDNETGEVCYVVEAVDIQGPYRSHIHVGGSEEKGGIVIDFGPTVDGTTGCLPNLPVETAAILANQTGHYAELHDISEEYTVRGQLSDAPGGHDDSTHPHDGDDDTQSETPTDDGQLVDVDGGGATTVLDNGTIFLEGPVPDQATADRLFNAVNKSRQAGGGNTPIVNNLQVVPGAPLPSGKIVIADAIFFEVNSSEVKAIDQVTIDAVTVLANSRPDWILTVVGHTDSTGSDVYNLELSLGRAGSVRDLLVSLGVPADKLLVRGAGETAPIGDNGTIEGKSQNRRIEFEFKPAS